MKINIKLQAFTLAEILITLSILGIIASATIPTIIRNYQRKVTVVKIKKYYSILSNTFDIYKINMKGYIPENSLEVFDIFIRPYFKIVDDVGTDVQKQKKILSGDKYKLLNGDEWTNLYNYSWYAAKLADGSTVIVRYSGTEFDYNSSVINYSFIYFDINGKNGPNQWGRDLFQFVINMEKDGTLTLTPFSINSNSGSKDFQTAAESCSKNSIGYQCAAWVVGKGNMNYLDCPGRADYNTGKCS